jgi:hypothetical protein
LLRIDDSDTPPQRFPSPVVVAAPPVHVLVVLTPPLLSELAARRLAAPDVDVQISQEGGAQPEGHYDVIVRNVPLAAGVTGDLVVDLPVASGDAPSAAATGERMSVERLDDVADLLARRWPPAAV